MDFWSVQKDLLHVLKIESVWHIIISGQRKEERNHRGAWNDVLRWKWCGSWWWCGESGYTVRDAWMGGGGGRGRGTAGASSLKKLLAHLNFFKDFSPLLTLIFYCEKEKKKKERAAGGEERSPLLWGRMVYGVQVHALPPLFFQTHKG